MRKKLLVSLTSTRERLGLLHLSLDSICRQSREPDEVHLYLSREAYLFDEGVKEIPASAQDAIDRNGVLVHWVPNTGPYRKLLPLLRERRDVLIVTIDDDTKYPSWTLNRLEKGFKKHGGIVAIRGRRVIYKHGEPEPYPKWPYVDRPSASVLHYPIGQSGILYDPQRLPEEIFDPAAMDLSPSACEPWFHLIARKAEIPAYIFGSSFPLTRQYERCLWSLNRRKNAGHLKAVANYLGVKL